MPLLVTDFSWTQTDSMVYISVPLKGASAKKVDILSTDEYIKVAYPPYLFEAFLFEPVDEVRSIAKVGNGAAVISLPKKTNKVWEQLMIDTGTDAKQKKKEIRERALLKYQEKISAQFKSKSEKKHTEKKYALETMMKLEKEERESIERMKNTERMKTTAELEAWQLNQKQKLKEEEEAQMEHRNQRQDQTEVQTLTKRQEKECSPGGKAKQSPRGVSVENKKKQGDLPAPRRAGNIQVSFTPRVFPTALRESRVQEEEEWLQKQAEARRAFHADVDELKDLTEEQRNPDWLKEKGDKCYAAGDYLSAVNAYSLAIRLNRKIPALYSNRAACHLKLRNLHKAVEDSSQALDLLTPPVAANAAARVRTHVRRGSAFCQLQLYAEGLQDYQAALKIDPHNEALQVDTQRIRDIIQDSTD